MKIDNKHLIKPWKSSDGRIKPDKYFVHVRNILCSMDPYIQLLHVGLFK
jgi:hypothetical protein